MTDQDPTSADEPPAATRSRAVHDPRRTTPAPRRRPRPRPAAGRAARDRSVRARRGAAPVAATRVERPQAGRPAAAPAGSVVGSSPSSSAVVAAGGHVSLLTGASGTSAVLAWMPADARLYTEVRLDLPGDQRQKLAEFMQAFPGFDDQAAIPAEARRGPRPDRRAAASDEQTYTADIEPWFGGQRRGSVGALPDVGDRPIVGRAHPARRGSVKDAAKASTWARRSSRAGRHDDHRAYNGRRSRSSRRAADGRPSASAFVGGTSPTRCSLSATVASVKAVDRHRGNGSLADERRVQGGARDDRPATTSAFSYFGPEAVVTSLDDDRRPGRRASSTRPQLDESSPRGPGLAGQDDPRSTTTPSRRPSRSSHIGYDAEHETSQAAGPRPLGHVVLAEGHDVGAALKRLGTSSPAEPATKDASSSSTRRSRSSAASTP